MKYELSDKQLQLLSAFLARVDLKGQEVQAFNELTTAFAQPIAEEVKSSLEETI